MKLDWAMLADAAQVREGLAFVIGGGIDTVNADDVPAPFNAAILIRLSLHRSETGRQHSLEVRISDEDGNQLAKVDGVFMVEQNPDIPIGWDHPSMFAMNVQGLELKRFGRYAIDILADGLHMTTLNFRAKQVDRSKGP